MNIINGFYTWFFNEKNQSQTVRKCTIALCCDPVVIVDEVVIDFRKSVFCIHSDGVRQPL